MLNGLNSALPIAISANGCLFIDFEVPEQPALALAAGN
jgi:hypothetical protein